MSSVGERAMIDALGVNHRRFARLGSREGYARVVQGRVESNRTCMSRHPSYPYSA